MTMLAKNATQSGGVFIVSNQPLMGSEPTAAGGGRKEASEWPRSVCNAAAPSARRTPGTATGTPVVLCAKGGNVLFQMIEVS